MSKKIMMLALAVVSAAFFALPAIASAQEIHLEPAESFKTEGPSGSLATSGEPTITCTATGGTGNFTAGSTTTGESTLDFTGCHTAVFGITASCKSEGAATAGTIASGGTFHLITWKNTAGTAFPAVLFTTKHTVIVCAGISKVTVTGDVIGTITSPKCGGPAQNTMTIAFTATSGVQDHILYTGNPFDLKARTGEEAEKTAALQGTVTNKQTNNATLNCT